MTKQKQVKAKSKPPLKWQWCILISLIFILIGLSDIPLMLRIIQNGFGTQYIWGGNQEFPSAASIYTGTWLFLRQATLDWFLLSMPVAVRYFSRIVNNSDVVENYTYTPVVGLAFFDQLIDNPWRTIKLVMVVFVLIAPFAIFSIFSGKNGSGIPIDDFIRQGHKTSNIVDLRKYDHSSVK